jgi:two-component sensor histidine kinase
MKLIRGNKFSDSLLLIGAFLISIFFLVFTNYLVSELSKTEIAKVEQLAKAYESLSLDNLSDYSPVLQTIKENKNIPIIITDEKGNIVSFKNFDIDETDTIKLKNQLVLMNLLNKPIAMRVDNNSLNYVYFKEQKAITFLRIFPYVQLALIALFLIISYISFNNRRKIQQNLVWVGMSKETAHQIGTPLSSLIAWIELLEENPSVENYVVEELKKDTERLSTIAERFSKIGSTPELEKTDIYDYLEKVLTYYKTRFSKKIEIKFSSKDQNSSFVNLNHYLFDWVIENILKNAIDAMEGVGIIEFEIFKDKKYVYLDIKDNGKGMPKSIHKRIFEPGFTTKKRGWGLGLSLSKRIIEDYHKGKIKILESEVNFGTTFRIALRNIT